MYIPLLKQFQTIVRKPDFGQNVKNPQNQCRYTVLHLSLTFFSQIQFDMHVYIYGYYRNFVTLVGLVPHQNPRTSTLHYKIVYFLLTILYKPPNTFTLIHEFIPDIYIAPLQETYSEALSVQLRSKRNV